MTTVTAARIVALACLAAVIAWGVAHVLWHGFDIVIGGGGWR